MNQKYFMFYKLDGKYIVLQKDNKIFVLSQTGALNTVLDKLFFANPFDCWDGLFWFGRSEEEIKDILLKGLIGFTIESFKSKNGLNEFIKKQQSTNRRQLIHKYKDTKMINIPLKDLKTLGLL